VPFVLPAHENQESRLEDTCKVIENALSGSKSGNAVVVTKATFMDVCTENLYSLILKLCEEDVGLVVVSCASFEGDFRYHLLLSSALNQHPSKQALSLALQARQGAAAQHGQAALFEVVVGYIAGGKSGSMLICLPENWCSRCTLQCKSTTTTIPKMLISKHTIIVLWREVGRLHMAVQFNLITNL
jgi:hypothetical protein